MAVLGRILGAVLGDIPEVDVTISLCGLLLVSVFSIFDRKLVSSALALPKGRAWLWVLGVSALSVPTLEVCFWLLRALGFSFIEYLEPYTKHGWPLWVPSLLLVALTPVTEEIAFRGIIQRRLESVLGAREAWIVQAALFSAAHLSPVILFTHFLMGLAMGFLFRKSRSLYPGMVLHAAWNGWVLWRELG